MIPTFQLDSPRRSQPGTPGKPSGSSTPQPQELEETIIRSLHKSINRRDGPGFVAAVARFNDAVNSLREGGAIEAHLSAMGWGGKMKMAEWEEMVDFVHDQAYSRVVGPYSNALEVRGYSNFGRSLMGVSILSYRMAFPSRKKRGLTASSDIGMFMAISEWA